MDHATVRGPITSLCLADAGDRLILAVTAGSGVSLMVAKPGLMLLKMIPGPAEDLLTTRLWPNKLVFWMQKLVSDL